MTDKTYHTLMNAALVLGLPVWAFAEFYAGLGVWAFVLGAGVSLAAMIGVWWLAEVLRRRDEQSVTGTIIAREDWSSGCGLSTSTCRSLNE